ncbi:hypothetical protein WSM22_45730 [Cytophagales bacterium WSM2-2]|nr:hypothetical protein WSM22_45730 [Cytophagales bacterium WSM2-2]
MLLGLYFANYGQSDCCIKQGNKNVQLVSVFAGNLSGWETNDDYVFSGFYLQAERVRYLVKFSPNMGTQLTSELKIGNRLEINGVFEKDTLNGITIRLVSITTDGKYIYNRIFNESTRPPVEEFKFGSGKIRQLQKNEQGNSKSLILDDRTILRIPANVIEALNTLLITGAYISYSGFQAVRDGEFATVNYPIIRCVTFTINDKQYLIF